ncbi:MAG: hypothetical protein PHD82_09745, partial [Candidatus Riflebacteria bacterium]|nr:hypothetical protein [Candidatus Riflebacteria bacterium]
IGSNGTETGSLKFPLMSLFKEHNNDIEKIRQAYNFKVEVVISQKLNSLNSLTVYYNSPMFDGKLPLPAAVDLVDNVIFDFSCLTFSDSGLKKVKVAVKKETSGDKLEFNYSQKNSEQSVVFIVAAAKEGDEKPEQLIPTVLFEAGKTGRIKWAHNGKDLREIDPSLYFLLFDSDWEPASTTDKN